MITNPIDIYSALNIFTCNTICNSVIYRAYIVNAYINNYDKVPIKLDTCDC